MRRIPIWRKSSYSNSDGGCVEINVSTWDEIRDSKDPYGPTLKVNVPAFIAALQAKMKSR
jgi:hypothetical protein